ncbi:myb-like protein X, partial [Anoplophora glabripennis]|uniref:myb-like protein X n=1 Tax=Anoplophora glabripennis TaxID=217634 RepID=UPI000C7914E6
MSNRTRKILELVEQQNQINGFNGNCLIDNTHEEIAINKTDPLDKTESTNCMITETVFVPENDSVFKDPDSTIMFANLENIDICCELPVETPVGPLINIQELDIVFLDGPKTDNANCEMESNLFFGAEDMNAIILNSQPVLTANENEQEQSEENRNDQDQSEENKNEQEQSEENKNEQDQSKENKNEQEQRDENEKKSNNDEEIQASDIVDYEIEEQES